jgi:hypothetical protein
MNQNEIDNFKKEASSDYFKMQMENEKNMKILKSSIIILMIFLPLLIISYKSFKIIMNVYKNDSRIDNDKKNISNYGLTLLENNDFLSSLSFKENKAIIYLADIYNGKYSITLDKIYFDNNYTHQCLGYFIITKDDSKYQIDTSNYCKM